MSPLELQRGICILQNCNQSQCMAGAALASLVLNTLKQVCLYPPNATSKCHKVDRYGVSSVYLLALSTAAELKLVIDRLDGGAGVLDRVGGADRLCAMCALTR